MQRTHRPIAIAVLGALLVTVFVVSLVLVQSAERVRADAVSPGSDAQSSDARDSAAATSDAPATHGGDETGLRVAHSVEDGAIPAPEGLSVWDDGFPAIANLDSELLAAVRAAATAAAEEGIELRVTSGWRSPAYQSYLLQDAIAEYGSEEEAAKWVATPETSLHVSGQAVDVGPYDAISWLMQRGSAYGLCQIYANEEWHYELRPEAAQYGCPALYRDPTEDPRLQG